MSNRGSVLQSGSLFSHSLRSLPTRTPQSEDGLNCDPKYKHVQQKPQYDFDDLSGFVCFCNE